MARPRKPTAELELSGAFKKDPQRRKTRENEPPPNGPIGQPPVDLTPDQRKLWHEVVGLVPPSVLAKSDRLLIEMITRLLEKLRSGEIRGNEQNLFLACLSRLGLTPADRSRVQIPDKVDENGEKDDFATFLATSSTGRAN